MKFSLLLDLIGFAALSHAIMWPRNMGHSLRAVPHPLKERATALPPAPPARRAAEKPSISIRWPIDPAPTLHDHSRRGDGEFVTHDENKKVFDEEEHNKLSEQESQEGYYEEEYEVGEDVTIEEYKGEISSSESATTTSSLSPTGACASCPANTATVTQTVNLTTIIGTTIAPSNAASSPNAEETGGAKPEKSQGGEKAEETGGAKEKSGGEHSSSDKEKSGGEHSSGDKEKSAGEHSGGGEHSAGGEHSGGGEHSAGGHHGPPGGFPFHFPSPVPVTPPPPGPPSPTPAAPAAPAPPAPPAQSSIVPVVPVVPVPASSSTDLAAHYFPYPPKSSGVAHGGIVPPGSSSSLVTKVVTETVKPVTPTASHSTVYGHQSNGQTAVNTVSHVQTTTTAKGGNLVSSANSQAHNLVSSANSQAHSLVSSATAKASEIHSLISSATAKASSDVNNLKSSATAEVSSIIHGNKDETAPEPTESHLFKPNASAESTAASMYTLVMAFGFSVAFIFCGY